jgi:hypothetical protein
MRKNLFICSASALLVLAFALSCSDSGGGNDPIKKARITGVSQKGPFVEGSEAVLYELNDSFEQTGRSFTDIIADNKGSFEIKNIELVSPYALLKASGFYRNENTGEISSAPITLFAIADIREKDQVNVNILTHLEYYRVLALAESGKTVKDAKKQAQREIFAVFGISSDNFKDSEDMTIFGTTESDAALLAISVLLQSDLSEGEFSQRLTNFSQAIKNGGSWENEEAKSAMADWASSIDLPQLFCRYNGGQDNCWKMPTNDGCISGQLVPNCSYSDETFTKASYIKHNILSWGLSSEVPYFEKYMRDYWTKAYGLGSCDASNEREIKRVYKSFTLHYVCEDGLWKGIFDIWNAIDYILGDCSSLNDGETKEGWICTDIGWDCQYVENESICNRWDW